MSDVPDASDGIIKQLLISGVCLGSTFFGGILGNLAATLIQETGSWAVKRLINKVPELSVLLARGDASKNHDLFRAIRRAECVATLGLIDGAILDHTGLKLGERKIKKHLLLWRKSHQDETLAGLCRIRNVFVRTHHGLTNLPLNELEKLQGTALSDLPSLVSAGTECFASESIDELRQHIVSKYISSLETSLCSPEAGFILVKAGSSPQALGALPTILLFHIKKHPGGWWDALRVAFRQELKDPANAGARTAWEIDIQAHTHGLLGQSYNQMTERLNTVDSVLDKQWQKWLIFREDFDEFSDEVLSQLKNLRDDVHNLADGQDRIKQGQDQLIGLVQKMQGFLERQGAPFNASDASLEIDRLKSRLSATENELIGLIKVVLDQPTISAEKLDEALLHAHTTYRASIDELRELRRRVVELPDVSVELDVAEKALSIRTPVDLERAQSALHAASQRFRAAIHMRRTQDAQIEFELLSQEATLSAARLRYLEAAALYGEACRCLLPEQTTLLAQTLCNQAFALDNHAEIFGGTASFREAVKIYDAMLTAYPRETMPIEWAYTQNNRATSLCKLGERLAGAEGLSTLSLAVQGYEAALEVYTFESTPLDWALTLNNLANAFRILGERLGGVDGRSALQTAVRVYEQVLGIRTRESMPVEWASTQNNRANALSRLGDCLIGAEGLKTLRAAVQAYDEVLEVCPCETMPVAWAVAQSNRATTLSKLGERLAGTEGLDALHGAVKAFDMVLKIHTREAMPVDWAWTQSNRAGALCRLGERLVGAEGLNMLRAAVQTCDLVLEVYTREAMPVDWASSQSNCAVALCRMAERLVGIEALDALRAARKACDDALKVQSRATMPVDWASTQCNCATALWKLGERQTGAKRLNALRAAVQACDAALEEQTRDTMPVDWAATQGTRAVALCKLGESLIGTEGLEALRAAVHASDAALEVHTRDSMPVNWASTQSSLAVALCRLGERLIGAEGLEALRAAVHASDAALEVHDRETMPINWASTQSNRAIVLWKLGERQAGVERLNALRAAVRACDAALKVYTRDTFEWSRTQDTKYAVLRCLNKRR